MPINPNNDPAQFSWQVWVPTLQGPTDNPAATLSTQLGRFILLASMLFYQIKLVSTTMTKSTLTDLLGITLPINAATVTGATWQGAGRVENTTPIPNPTYSEVASAGAVLNFRANAAAGNASLPLTYAVASPGIGVLTNTITFNATGFYEI